MNRFFVTLLFAALSACLPARSLATPFFSAKYRFTLEYPDSLFEATPVQEPLVGALLRSKQGGFPTFNVLVQPGELPATELSPAAIAAKVVESYRQVGITDAQLAATAAVHISGRPSIRCELRFMRGGEAMSAEVLVVPGAERHYVLTYMDRRAQFESGLALGRAIEESFSPSDPLPLTVPEARGTGLRTAALTAVFAGACALLFIRRRGTRRAGPAPTKLS